MSKLSMCLADLDDPANSLSFSSWVTTHDAHSAPLPGGDAGAAKLQLIADSFASNDLVLVKSTTRLKGCNAE